MREIILASMGEMTLKGLNRKSFENALMKALRNRTANAGTWRLHAAQSVVYLEPQDAEAEAAVDTVNARVLRVFGIAAVARAAVCEKELGAICAAAAEQLDGQLRSAKSFKVKARRSDKSFALGSLDIAREVGGCLLQRYPHLKAEMKDPELVVTVEIRETAAYVHGGKTPGAGGLPIPSSGRAALLLSGGIDSPVAAWMMAKRGLALVAVHFASPPYTSPRAAAKVEALAELVARWAGPIPYNHVPYTEAQVYLRDALPRQDYFTVLMRRSMLRISAIIAERENCEALVTGESLAQVASQTLAAIACTDQAQALPVLRPCIGMDKTEIMTLARQIGTYETSIQPYEDCCTIFTPAHPKTKPKLPELLALEANLMPRLTELEAEAAQNAKFKLIQAQG